METNSKKRSRDDSDSKPNSPESKRVNSATDSFRVEPDPELVDSSEVEYIPEGILDILDDTGPVNDGDSVNEDLDSVMKSFEEEILNQHSYQVPSSTVTGPGESQPELGYLLEATDDELGLPPTEARITVNEPLVDLTVGNSSDAIEFGNMIELEHEFPSYDTFDFGLNEATTAANNNGNNLNSGNGDYVTVDGLFDYSEPSEFSGLSWQPESLHAL